MSDNLEYILMPQLVDRPEIKCIGIAYGTCGTSGSSIDKLIAACEKQMEEMVREKGGTVIIDPEVTVLSADNYYHSVVVRCKVGVVTGEPSEPHSE